MVVPDGATEELQPGKTGGQLNFETILLGKRSILRLMPNPDGMYPPVWRINASRLVLREGAQISVEGVDGAPGDDGENGKSALGNCTRGIDGGEGLAGGSGQNGGYISVTTRQLLIPYLYKAGARIVTSGGDGGIGGRGGDGGTGGKADKSDRCPGGNGGNGGEGGDGGNGGAAGNLLVQFDTAHFENDESLAFLDDVRNFIVHEGSGGAGGSSGKAGVGGKGGKGRGGGLFGFGGQPAGSNGRLGRNGARGENGLAARTDIVESVEVLIEEI